MHRVSEYRAGSIVATAYRSDDVGKLYDGEFDLAFIIPSWDERCSVVASAARLRATKAVLVKFSEMDRDGLRSRNDQLLQNFCRRMAAEVAVVENSVTAVEDVWHSIEGIVVEEYVRMGRALRVFIDASTCPRYHTLGLIGEGVGRGIVRELTVAYTEGEYPEPEHESEISLTVGNWRTIPAPGYSGVVDPGKRRFLLVSVGFEGWKTLRVVSRSDPDRVSILFPEPGTRPGYAERTRIDNAQLIDEYCIPENQIVKAAAADAVGAWHELGLAQVERPKDENLYFVCSGTKPHSIALALRALELRSPAVLYNVPEEHRAISVRPTGMPWRYDIVGVTTPF